MPRFICDNCGKEFARKNNLDYHIKNNSCKDNPFECENCGRKFTTRTGMTRHMKTTCIVTKEQNAKKDEILERLIQMEQEFKKLKEENSEQVEKLKTDIKQLTNENKKLRTVSKVINSNNTTNNNNVQNINTGTVNNITLVGYGKEDISKLDRNEILKILRDGYNSTVTLTEAVHFNPKYPEYHNVYIGNMKDQYAMMYDGNKWTLTTKEKLIDTIYDDKKTYIEDNLEDFVNSLTISRRNALKRWLDTEEDDEKIKDIKKRIKLLLYNNKNMIIENNKMINKTKTIKDVN